MDWLAAAIEASAFGQAMRSSAWAYPIANVAHLFGLALLAGGIMAVDLRILGFGRRIPFKPLSEWLTPFAIAGLLVFAVSGAAMFAADATTLVRNDVFLLKLALVALALGNALVFRRSARKSLHARDGRFTAWDRGAAALSILLWSAAIIAGRMIAYQ